MKITDEQKQTVASWVAAGDSLSVVQKKLSEHFKLALTYMDVRFLVDDLGLELKNAAPKADASDVTKAAAPRPAAPVAAAPGSPDAADLADADADADLPVEEPPLGAEDDTGLPPAGTGSVTLELDRIMRPGTAVSGSVTFSDGVSGKWALDQYGRLMLDTGRKGYQPSAPDVQAFQRELQAQLQRQGY